MVACATSKAFSLTAKRAQLLRLGEGRGWREGRQRKGKEHLLCPACCDHTAATERGGLPAYQEFKRVGVVGCLLSLSANDVLRVFGLLHLQGGVVATVYRAPARGADSRLACGQTRPPCWDPFALLEDCCPVAKLDGSRGAEGGSSGGVSWACLLFRAVRAGIEGEGRARGGVVH